MIITRLLWKAFNYFYEMKTSINLKGQDTVIDNNTDEDKLDNLYGLNSKNYKNSKKIIISIVSNKGGVGKTSIAIALGMFFSQIKKKNTLLLELDSSPGDFGIMFDIERDKSLELALRFPENYNKFVKNICNNMDALKGISNPLVAENINKGIINNLINHVLKEYDCIIVDTQTIINGLVLDVLRLSNKIFVVSEYTLESTSRVSNLINVLEKKFSIPKSSMKLIMNKKNFLPFFKVWDVAKIINIPIYALIPYDNRFDKSKFLFNKNGILRTRFFKGISKILSGIDFEDSNNVKR